MDFLKNLDVDSWMDKFIASKSKAVIDANQSTIDQSISKAVDQAINQSSGLVNQVMFVVAGIFAAILIFVTLKKR